MKPQTLRLTMIFIPLSLLLTGCAALKPQDTTRLQQLNDPIVWVQSVEKGGLRADLLMVKPAVPGPHPAVIVHPGIGETAMDQRQLLERLARQGYLAAAVDYRRRIDGELQSLTLPWRNPGDARLALDALLQHPLVNSDQVLALGFSLGGAHTLVMAAQAPELKAAVVYYPMVDFNRWVTKRKESSLFWRLAFRVMRWQYDAEDKRHNDQTHFQLLARYSAINHVNTVRAPVLIIHGDRDTTAPLQDSRRFLQDMTEAGSTPTQLMVVNNAPHAFDARPSTETARAWRATLDWFNQYATTSATTVARNQLETATMP